MNVMRMRLINTEMPVLRLEDNTSAQQIVAHGRCIQRILKIM